MSELKDEDVKLKISYCQKCNGIIRAAVSHMMTVKSRNAFMKEVMEYNLSVREVPLLEYRQEKPDWCECEETPINASIL